MTGILPRAQAFFAFMRERELIRLRKEAGQPRPWTDDAILQEFKFTNVRRHHDWTSLNLRREFYTPNFDADPREILMNAALFRYFGTYEFAEAVGWQNFDTFDFDGIEDTATERLADKERVFTGAYVITNQGISAPKQEVVVHYFMKDLHAAVPNIIAEMQMTRSWRRVAEQMMKINGFGGTGFMTKEVLLDTTYTGFWGDRDERDDGVFSYPEDWQEWTPVGPGARRGVARVMDIEDPDSREAATYKRSDGALGIILGLHATQAVDGYWPIDEYGALSPTDIQFQLCEFDKYERVRLGQGRPRSKYRPREAS